MANLTGEGNYESNLNQTLSAPPAGIAEFFTALNIFLSITAAVGNALVIIALKNVSSIYPPTKLFFRCMAVTDLCVGLMVEPLYAFQIMSHMIKMNANVLFYVYKVQVVISYILCGVSVLTSTAISVDRLLALFVGLRYRHVVTLRRVRLVIACFWLTAALVGCIWVWREGIATSAASVVLIVSVVTSIFCYTKIHLKLRHQQAQTENIIPHEQQNGVEIPLNMARYKKSISSILWVQLALVACYVPWGIVAVLYANDMESFVAWKATTTLVFLNSSINPILYCWKIEDVKEAVKDTIRQLCCF